MRSGSSAKEGAGTAAAGVGFGRRGGGYDMLADARETFAAERAAEAAEPSFGSGLAAKLPAKLGVAALVAGFVALRVLAEIVRPIHYWDAVTLVGIAVLPVEAALLFFFTQDHPRAMRSLCERVFADNRLGWLKMAGMAVVFGIGLPAGLLLYANERLDDAPPTREVLPVESAWTTVHRSSTSYYVGVEPSAHPPSRFFSFYTVEPVRVSRDAWERAEPGRSRLALRLHPGRFGLAWYDEVRFEP